MLEGLIIHDLKRFKDERGYFYESFNKSKVIKGLNNLNFVQDNVAYTEKKYTFRGLHQQKGQYSQGKLISVVSGTILDIVVDIRPESATFGDHSKILIDDENSYQLFVPDGFLHGYLTLKDETTVIYKTTCKYKPEAEIGVNIFDENLKIELPCSRDEVILSPKDKVLNSFEEIKKEILKK
tara:strand:+ start:97 stop:639 length:543 start_codon:yes stop_codon:yes gene_type:complete